MSMLVSPVNWSNNSKKNGMTAGVAVLSAGCAGIISKSVDGKNYNWNNSINNTLKNFGESGKKFFGSSFLQDIASRVAKTSSKQKIMSVLFLGTLAAIMAVREYFSKEEGKDVLKPVLRAKNLRIARSNNVLAMQDAKIKEMEADLKTKDDLIESYRQELKKSAEVHNYKDGVIQGYKKVINEVTDASKRLGVFEDLKKELGKDVPEAD